MPKEWRLAQQPEGQDRNPYAAIIDRLVATVLAELNSGSEQSKAVDVQHNVCAVLVPPQAAGGKPAIMIGAVIKPDHPLLRYVVDRGGAGAPNKDTVQQIGGFLPLVKG